jgi:hypothetical protein
MRRLRLVASQHLEVLANSTGVDHWLDFLGIGGIQLL